MVVYTRSYTSGTRDTPPSLPAIRTAASETRVTTQKPVPTHDTSSKSWMQWASNRLEAIAKLEPDWNSYGANRPSPWAIANASILLQTVYDTFGRWVREKSQPQVVAPRADGGIQIGWGMRPIEIVVHADPSGGLGYLYIERRGNTPEFKEVQNATWNEVLELIAKVVFTVPR
jgi:hypothetical protein